MQTFLPYSTFEKSAKVLDYKRLGKQRVEAWQIYNTLMGRSSGWENHPAVKMWRGYEKTLLLYGITMCEEWIRRGYNDTMLPKFQAEYESNPDKVRIPEWLGNYLFHASHRSNLLRKFPEHYRTFWPKYKDSLPYVWPSEE